MANGKIQMANVHSKVVLQRSELVNEPRVRYPGRSEGSPQFALKRTPEKLKTSR